MNEKLLKYFNITDPESFVPGVWASKYKYLDEQTPDEMHMRMASEFARIRANKDTSSDVFEWTQYFYSLFKNFEKIIPQGSIMATLGTNTKASLSNCFVIGQPEDSYGGILQKDQELVQLMKRRGGVGLDISTLRPSGTSVTNSAKTSTGAVSFMERFSNSTREVAQGGRRGALMLSIDCRHPDVLDFITSKKDLTKITGANISVMVRDDFMEAVKNDEDYLLRFPTHLNPPETDKTLENIEYNVLNTITLNSFYPNGLKFSYKKVKAREYWNEIVNCAWASAEPGQIFIDNHWNYSPDGVYKQYKGITTNPCGEIFMQMYDACRLLCLNLFSIVNKPFTKQSKIDYDLLYSLSYEMMLLADDLIDLESEYIDRIIDKIMSDPESTESKKAELDLWLNIKHVAISGRRAGNGITGLADMLAALNLKYDSKKAISVVDKVMHVKMQAELDATIFMGDKYGVFKGFDRNKEFFIDQEGRFRGQNQFYEFIASEFPEQARAMFSLGRRNVSWSTIAPTGSVSILGKAINNHNISAGCEPQFALWYTRRKKVNPGDEGVRVDFIDDNGDSWQEYPVVMGAFKDWLIHSFLNYSEDNPDKGRRDYTDIEVVKELVDRMGKEELENLFKQSPWNGSTANDIDWKKRVEMQAVLQKYTSHSISSTINLPSSASKKDVANIYEHSYDLGLKGVTIYRDGSRSGVLISNETVEEDLSTTNAPKRPKVVPSKVHQSTSKGEEWLIVIGFMGDKPYEVFCSPNTYELPKGTLEGDLIKESRGNYRLRISEEYEIDNIITEMSDSQEALTRMISTALRHGASIKYIVEQLNKTSGDLQSFAKVIARNLKKYIPDATESTGIICDNCGSENLIYHEGCLQCTDCGHSKC